MKVFPALASCGLRMMCLLFFVLAPSGCEKRGGEATVISKQHIPAEPAVNEPGKERAATEEQWRINVEMRSDLRKVRVLVEAAQWDRLRIGDSVQVQFSEGKYTGTIWSSDLK